MPSRGTASRVKPFSDSDAYGEHLVNVLPDAYLAGFEFKFYFDLVKQVEAGEIEVEEAIRKSPALKHVGGACPCSKSVRWIVEDEDGKEVNPATVPSN